MKRSIYLVALGALAAAPIWAGAAPVAVSPGDASKLVLVADTCPTFSWGQVEGAHGYELVVYRIREESRDENPVLRQALPGSVHGWTPALGRGLERGGRYAWVVRAVGAEMASDWSAPRLFEVAPGPSDAEFEQAVAVVERYLEERGVGPDGSSDTKVGDLGEGTDLPAVAAIEEQAVAAPAAAAAAAEVAPGVPGPPASVSLITEGALGVGTSLPLADLHVVGSTTLGGMLLAANAGFSGDSELMLAEDSDGTFGMKIKYDGSLNELQVLGHSSVDTEPWLTIERDTGVTRVTNLRGPDPPCFDFIQRFADCGNGTVTDGVTGLIYLKEADCLAVNPWVEANENVANLKHGECSLTDGSRAGDWRLPTEEEWGTILDSTCDENPKIVGNADGSGTPDCFSVYPWAEVLLGGAYWSFTTRVDDTDTAWRAALNAGAGSWERKINNYWSWPVRDGH